MAKFVSLYEDGDLHKTIGVLRENLPEFTSNSNKIHTTQLHTKGRLSHYHSQNFVYPTQLIRKQTFQKRQNTNTFQG